MAALLVSPRRKNSSGPGSLIQLITAVLGKYQDRPSPQKKTDRGAGIKLIKFMALCVQQMLSEVINMTNNDMKAKRAENQHRPYGVSRSKPLSNMTHFRLIHYNSPPRKSIPGMLNFTVAVKQVILSPLAAKTSASTLYVPGGISLGS
uniref:Uncharacterized protein n=1 Tax=Photinus pyralis TaxID=7054 RepID=A0A1Y1M642_PHOPY